MAVKVLEDGRIADEFEMGEEPHVLRDALVMQPADYDALSVDEIAALKQARYDNWIALMTNSPVDIS